MLTEPLIEELPTGYWGVWVDDGDELVACTSKAEAEAVRQALLRFRGSSKLSRIHRITTHTGIQDSVKVQMIFDICMESDAP